MKVIFGWYPLSNASNAYWMNPVHNSKKLLKNPKVIRKNSTKAKSKHFMSCLALNTRKKRKLGI
jgi:hypothetical protein